MRPNGDENRHAFHDTGAASALLTMEATARGLFVRQMAGIEVDKVRETYAVPDDYGVVAGIALGYQGEPESLPEHRQEPEVAPRSRNPLTDMVFAGTFGNSSPLIPQPAVKRSGAISALDPPPQIGGFVFSLRPRPGRVHRPHQKMGGKAVCRSEN